MRKILILLLFAYEITLHASSSAVSLTDEERKTATVACANNHLESCEILLKSGLPSVKACNVRTECEFSGWLYMQVQDYIQALPYLKKACDNNHWDGCDKLGRSYQNLRDYKKAKKYYKIACDHNSMNGCYNLAMLYYGGLGVRHSYEMANVLYKRICDNRLGIGCLRLAMSYAKGYGVFQSLITTQQLLQQGCEFGNNESCDLYDIYKDKEEMKDKEDLDIDSWFLQILDFKEFDIE